MTGNKTVSTKQSPYAYLEAFEPEVKRADALVLLKLFEEATGFEPVMWRPRIIGFGRYHYRYSSGREGDCHATGFAPGKSKFSVYIMPGYQDYDDILARIGKHKRGRSCLYFNKLSDINLDVLAELVRTGLKDLNATWPVAPQ